MKLIIDSETETFLENLVMRCLNKHYEEKNATIPLKLYTVNAIAKKLGISHSTVKSIIRNGLLKTTADGRIAESELNNYLKNKK